MAAYAARRAYTFTGQEWHIGSFNAQPKAPARPGLATAKAGAFGWALNEDRGKPTQHNSPGQRSISGIPRAAIESKSEGAKMRLLERRQVGWCGCFLAVFLVSGTPGLAVEKLAAKVTGPDTRGTYGGSLLEPEIGANAEDVPLTDGRSSSSIEGDEQQADLLQQLIESDQQEDGKLELVLQYARDRYSQITENIRDYTCTLVKRERVEGRLHGYQRIAAKIRHEQKQDDTVLVPFSVYLQFLTPDRVRGREVLYVHGQNNGDLIARRGGRTSPNMTVQLDPISPLAMVDNRYPILEIGIRNLTKRLIEVVEEEIEYNDGEVTIFRNAKLEGRPCIHIQMTHHTRRPNLQYHKARVFVDTQWKIPVYFASYDWPAEEGGKPPLLEEYAYINVKLNVGLQDEDFDVKNPKYHFNLKRLNEPSPSPDTP